MDAAKYRSWIRPSKHDGYAAMVMALFENAESAARGYHLQVLSDDSERRAEAVSEARRWLAEDGLEVLREAALATRGFDPPNDEQYARWLVRQRGLWLADTRTAGCGRHNTYARDEALRCVSGCKACRKARSVARRARDLDLDREIEQERARRAGRAA